MDWQGWLSLSTVVGVLLTLVFTRLGPHFVVMAALTLLSVCGVLTAQEALAGFSNPGLITVATMFVVAAGMEASLEPLIFWSIVYSVNRKTYAPHWRVFSRRWFY